MEHHPIVQTDLWNSSASTFIDSFRITTSSLGHPTPLTWTHVTTTFGGTSTEKIYDNNPQTLADLKDNIRREIKYIPADMIGQVSNNFNVRVAAVICQGGAWIEHIINY